MKQNISIIRGTTNTFNISVTDANGNEYTLADGEKLIFGVKMYESNVDYNLLKVLTSDNYSDGHYVLTLLPIETARMSCGMYCYDIGLQSGTNYYIVIELSNFEIRQNITKQAVT